MTALDWFNLALIYVILAGFWAFYWHEELYRWPDRRILLRMYWLAPVWLIALLVLVLRTLYYSFKEAWL